MLSKSKINLRRQCCAVAILRTIHTIISSGGISPLPMLIQCIRDFGQPGAVIGQFNQFGCGEILHAAGRRITQRLEQPGIDQRWNVMRLAVDDPRRLLCRQTRRQPAQQPQELMLLLIHSIASLKSLNAGCRLLNRFTFHHAPSFVTYLAQ